MAGNMVTLQNAIIPNEIGVAGIGALSPNPYAMGKNDFSHDKLITPDFFEINKIVAPDETEAVQLAGLMQSLAEQLLGKRYDPAKHQFTFLFSDKPNPNGFIKPTAIPPIIVTNLGLIKGAKSIDEVAGYLAHELGHLYVEEEFGNELKRNSKAEEAAADIYSMAALIEAGYSANGINDLIGHFKGSEDSWRALEDVHPLDRNRLSMLAKTKVAAAREGYQTDRAVQPLPGTWMNNVQLLHYMSPLERKQHADGYEHMGVEEKLRWIRNETEALNDEREKDSKIDKNTINSRVETLHKIYDDVTINPQASPQVEAVHETFSTFLRCRMTSRKKFYEDTLRKLDTLPTQGKWPLLGEFRTMQHHIDAFLAAENVAEAEAAATAMTTGYYSSNLHDLYNIENAGWRSDNDPLFQERLDFKTIALPTFAALSEQTQSTPVELPVSKHLRWLKETESRSIASALNMIGAEPLIKAAGLRSPSDNVIGRIIDIPRSDPAMKREDAEKEYATGLILDEQVKVSGILEPVKFARKLPSLPDNAPPEDFENSFRSYARERANWERAILDKGVNWELLETDAIRFIEVYGAALWPTLSFERVEHPFAMAVEERLRNLQSIDSEKAKAIAFTLENHVGRAPEHYYQYHIPGSLQKNYRVGVDPDHPFVTLFLSLVDHSKKGDEYRPDLRFLYNDLVANVRYTNVFERANPLDESHLCFSRDILEYDNQSRVHIGLIGDEFRATNIARTLQTTDSLTLRKALGCNSGILSLQENNTLKFWLLGAIQAPLKVAVERFHAQPLEVQIQELQDIDKSKLFSDAPGLRNALVNVILENIAALPDPVERQSTVLSLLYQHNEGSEECKDIWGMPYTRKWENTYNCMLSLPKQRKKASEFIAQGLQATYGTVPLHMLSALYPKSIIFLVKPVEYCVLRSWEKYVNRLTVRWLSQNMLRKNCHGRLFLI